MKSNIYSIRRALCFASVSHDIAFFSASSVGLNAEFRMVQNLSSAKFTVPFFFLKLRVRYFITVQRVFRNMFVTWIPWAAFISSDILQSVEKKIKTEKMHVTTIIWTYFPCGRYSLRRQHATNRSALVHGFWENVCCHLSQLRNCFVLKKVWNGYFLDIRDEDRPTYSYFIFLIQCVPEDEKEDRTPYLVPTERMLLHICYYFPIHSSNIQLFTIQSIKWKFSGSEVTDGDDECKVRDCTS